MKKIFLALLLTVAALPGLNAKSVNGHEYVDLGLSVKWATCNVGASSPYEYGDYFAWGETTTKADYTKENCKLKDSGVGFISGDPEYDAARANWGATWRLPTESEMQELVENCTWKWTTKKGVNGYVVKSKKNGKSIFLPAAGVRDGSSLKNVGEEAIYWTDVSHSDLSDYASMLGFNSYDYDIQVSKRYYGLSIRPVLGEEVEEIDLYADDDDNYEDLKNKGLIREFVDMGLSVKWATCNVGAASPSEHGESFAWGETEAKPAYTIENCKLWNKKVGDIAGHSKYDAASAKSGREWRLPTEKEMRELVECCDWIWTTEDSVQGYRVKSRVNGNSIFLPVDGEIYEAGFLGHYQSGSYWTSSPNEKGVQFAAKLVFELAFYGVHNGSRFRGANVRPVLRDGVDAVCIETIDDDFPGGAPERGYINLGLSVNWATFNVGASSSSDFGDYFAWGETNTKDTFTEENYRMKENEIADIVGNAEYDAACAIWGSEWRLPTPDEMQELEDYCDWKWTTQDGIFGFLVTSKINGNSIFLPAAGARDGVSLERAGAACYYMTSVADKSMYCSSGLYGSIMRNYVGQSVRPVYAKKNEMVEKEEPALYVEMMPEFPGGKSGLANFLRENLKYPEKSRNCGSQGKVFVTFVVETDGSISEVEMDRGTGDPLLDKEAIRVVEAMPKWTPGERAGVPVRVRYTLPISFRLE